MTGLLYTRFELLRTFRNRRFFILSLGFPLVLYFLIAGPQKNVHDLAHSGISAPLYYMAGLASFGTMASMISSGARIAAERQAGWTRQLRITPLTPREYFRAKVIAAYAMAITSLVLLYIAGAILGVRLAAHQWLSMTGLILIALLPFAALGIMLGHLMNVDSIGPLTGGLVAILAFLAGTWFPLTSGFLYDVGQYLPGYWIVQASHIALHGHGWATKGWVVIAVWALVLVFLARLAYRRDTQRV
jgi:ABC-2 type transport system permease protein